MHQIGVIRRFQVKRFVVIVDAVEDDTRIDDLDSEAEGQKEILAKLQTGEWVQFCARVRVLLDGDEIGADYLGGCIYSSLDEFQDHREVGKQNRTWAAMGEPARCGSYFADMIRTACKDARAHVRRLQAVKVRANG